MHKVCNIRTKDLLLLLLLIALATRKRIKDTNILKNILMVYTELELESFSFVSYANK
jgi:hypothetical protein